MAKKQEQTEIPGTERPRIDAIEEAAEDYREKRDARMAAGEQEELAKDTLRIVSHEHESAFVERDADGNPFYRLESGKSVVLIRSEEDVKVVTPKKQKKAKKDEAVS